MRTNHPKHQTYFNRALRKVQLRGELAPPRPGHVVLLVELLLQPRELVPGERGAVPPDVGIPDRTAVVAAGIQLRVGDRTRAIWNGTVN